jgi:hypothetical protein
VPTQITSTFKVTAVGTQLIGALASEMEGVPIDVDLLRAFGLYPSSDSTAIAGQTATRAIVVNMGQGGFAATATLDPGGPESIEKIALAAFVVSPWAAPPIVQFSGGGGSGASASVQMGLNSAALIILDAGGGYTGATVATLVGGDLAPGGTPAVISGVTIGGIDNHITGVTFSNPGSGYTTYPQIVFTDSGGGSGALIYAGLVPVGITLLTAGTEYTSAPTVSALAVFDASNPTFQGAAIQGWMQGPIADACRSPILYTAPVVT